MPPKSRILFLKKKWIIIHCVSSKGFNPRWSREGGGQLVTASGALRRWDCCRWRVWHEQNSTHIMASSRDLCRGMPTMFGIDCDCRESVIKLGDAMAGDVVFFELVVYGTSDVTTGGGRCLKPGWMSLLGNWWSLVAGIVQWSVLKCFWRKFLEALLECISGISSNCLKK